MSMPWEQTKSPTEILQAAASGDADAAAALIPLVYDQLRAAAQLELVGERPGHTLSPTALVHEAFVRLAGEREIPWQNRAHYYAAAAEAMRRILLDHARKRLRRGGKPLSLVEIGDVADLSEATPEQIVAVDGALRRLESEDPEAAGLVRLRFYAGLSVDQSAAALGLSPRTAARLWKYARARLYKALTDTS